MRSPSPLLGNEKDPAKTGSFSMCSVVKDVRTEILGSAVLPHISVHYIPHKQERALSFDNAQV